MCKGERVSEVGECMRESVTTEQVRRERVRK